MFLSEVRSNGVCVRLPVFGETLYHWDWSQIVMQKYRGIVGVQEGNATCSTVTKVSCADRKSTRLNSSHWE